MNYLCNLLHHATLDDIKTQVSCRHETQAPPSDLGSGKSGGAHVFGTFFLFHSCTDQPGPFRDPEFPEKK